MKDDEMAEEYKADYGIDLCCLCRECEVENINPCQHKKDAMYGYKDGFLAGLKAGRPVWHDLRENKNLVPDSPRLVLVKCIDSINCEFSYYIDNSWILNRNVPVIAWCEIPTFDKE